MNRNGPIALIFHCLFLGFLLAPILIVCAVAFTSQGYLSLPTEGLSLRWFRAIGDNPEFIRAFKDSLLLGAVSSTLAILVAVPAALAIARHQFFGREAIQALFLSPLMVPHIVLGIAFLRFFTMIGLGGTFAGLVLSHVIIILPFALRLILAVEQGTPGACSVNSNGTKDCGPGQINSIWFPVIAAGRVPPEVVQQALTFDPCYNIRVTAWILRREIDAVGWENFWTAVGNYHSHTPEFHARYLRRVVEAAKALSGQPK